MAAMNNVLSVEQLFTGRLFRVPDYQRGYAWDPQQRNEFLDDLDLLQTGREHYTGTVVLHQLNPTDRTLDAEGKEYAVVDIVDGQQRLTTIVLLLDAIRRSLAALRSDAATALAEGVRRTYVAATDVAKQPLYKLSLNSDCDHYFKTVSLNDLPGPEGPQISSERRLADGRSEFAAFLDRQVRSKSPQSFDWLVELYRKIAHQLRVTLYEVESAADVGVIFEVMNNRGKPLSELEKVKNYLLYAGSTLSLKHTLDVSVNGAWAEIFRQLMAAGLTATTDEDQLLRAHWLTGYDPQPRKWAGSKAIKARFDLRTYAARHEELLDGLLGYTEGLRACCVGFCDARTPERGDSFASMPAGKARDEVKTWSAKLIRTNVVAPFLPVLIATRLRFPGDSEKYLELVKLCEAFAFRVYRLLERRADAGQADLFRIGNQLHAGRMGFDKAMGELRSTLLAYCSDRWFGDAREREDYYWYGWAGLKYFLYEYEEHLAAQKGAVPKVGWDEVRRRERADSIEHILPQTPTDPYWLARFDAAARSRWTHDLGNLTLTKDNASYSNKPFPEKKGVAGSSRPCYAESPFFMERELALVPDWDPGQLAIRWDRLVDWARERWRVTPTGTPAGLPSPTVTADDDLDADAEVDSGALDDEE